ncbi:MAG TPA: alpha/beta hydrolase [Candidatus Binatia bacterium]|nr:alpha/beta hydrolase [Candidatus Binatia bacterium]
MKKPAHLHPRDLHGLARLAVDATGSVADLVEGVHHHIVRPPFLVSSPTPGRTGGIAGLVYASIRGATAVLGGAIDATVAPLVPLFGERATTPRREAALAALNGVLGDHLADARNPLAFDMVLHSEGQALTLTPRALAAAFPQRSARVAVLLHGLCMNDLQWRRAGHDHGRALARDLDYTPVYLRYNSGLHISTNGRQFSALLEDLVGAWPEPIEDLVIIGHSMGGLVTRSAIHYASLKGHAWPARLGRVVFLGTPHHGAPLERGGSWVHESLNAVPYVAPFSRLGKIRSAGITDLRHGNLVDEDWEGRDRFARDEDTRRHVALPIDVACYAIAATTGTRKSDIAGRFLGDGLVRVSSALGKHRDPKRALGIEPTRQWVAYGMHHMDLLSRPEVYERMKAWLAG